ncbi:ankyrin repeat-containing domain protein [Coprinopsis sp. MPI-PUGE-AT-0042]|nr:ankyrin repeat-containing domain protein [Coprinopsis sp. MPI-PUGE-AT-0042]
MAGYPPWGPGGFSFSGGLPAPAPFYHIDGGHFNDVGRDQHNMFHNAYNSYQFNNYSGFGQGPTLQEVLDWLSIANFRTILQDNLAKRTRGSGKWFLKNRRFRRWLKSKHGILWGVGMPGAGKTVLASIVVEYLQKEYLKELAGQVSAHEILVCFAYCRYTEPTSVCDILAALVRQALERANHILPAVEHLYLGLYNQHRLEGTRPSQEELVELLLEISKRFRLAFYILDGLDEAQDEIKHHLLRILSSINIHLLITSRPLPYLEATLPSVDRFEVVANGDDIDRLVARTIEQNPVFRALLEKEPTLKQKTIASVKQKANGMFLHASLQLSRLQQCRTVGELRDQLERFQPDVNTLYTDTLKRIMQAPELDASRGTTILLWIVFADKPVPAKDLQTVLAMDARGDFQPEHVVPKDSLVDLCHGLVTIESETQDVRLVHLTAKAVLEKLLLEIEPRPYARLASACITRLASCGFPKSMINDPETLSEAFKKHPFLRHAYTSWAFYARRCASSDTAIKKTLEDFLLSCTSFPKTIKSGGLSTVDCFDSLHLAAWYNFPQQLSALVKKGHDCTLATEKGKWTPLMAAAFQGCGTIVEQLLRLAKDAGKDVSACVNAVNSAGQDGLLLALENAHYNVAKIILETPGFQIHAASLGAYRSALRNTARLGISEAAVFLLKIPGMRVNGARNDGVTALMYAARHGRLFILGALLRFPGIVVDTVDKDGKDALRHAVEARKVEIVEALLRDPRVRTNARDEQGKTSLMEAAKQGYVDIVNVLLKVPDVDVNAANKYGHTALMYATGGGKIGVVEALLKARDIKVDALDKVGKTALAHTSKENQSKVEQLFKDRLLRQAN